MSILGESNDAFYMVWNPARSVPAYRHASIDAARAEAKRLARLSPNDEFFVLAAIERAAVRDPIEVTRLGDDFLPF